MLFAFSSTIVLHVYWCYLFIIEWQLDIQGAALAICLTCALNLCVVMFFTVCCSSAQKRIRICVCQNLLEWDEVKEYLWIGLPAMLMLCMEWWALEILCFSASFISTNALGAQTIAYNFYQLMFSIGFGF